MSTGELALCRVVRQYCTLTPADFFPRLGKLLSSMARMANSCQVAPGRTRADHHAPDQHPRPPGKASVACHTAWPLWHARPSAIPFCARWNSAGLADTPKDHDAVLVGQSERQLWRAAGSATARIA